MTTDAAPMLPELPVDWVREQFPALERSGILFDNAGGSVPLGRVADLVSEYMRRWPVQLGASYAESAEASERLSFARQEIAGIMGASADAPPTADEVVIGTSTSSLLSRLARSLAPSLGAGDEIIVTDVDHEANITPWRRLETSGVTVLTWNLNTDSQRLEPEDLRKLISDRTRLVCFTHASNILGETVPVAQVTRLAHDHGARVVVDGVAYAPHRPIDVRHWEVDFYAFSLYKVYGPHCAALYVRGREMESLANLNHQFMDGSHGPGKLEPGAFAYELLYGACGVPDYLRELSDRITGESENSSFGPAYTAIGTHEERLSSRLLSFLSSEPAVRIVGPERPGPARLPTISFVVDGCRSSEIPIRLDPQGIGIRWGHFYAPRLIDKLGLAKRDGVVRVSMVHYNTLEEVDRLISGLAPILSGAVS